MFVEVILKQSVEEHFSHNNCTIEKKAKSLQFFHILIPPKDNMQNYASEVYQLGLLTFQ